MASLVFNFVTWAFPLVIDTQLDLLVSILTLETIMGGGLVFGSCVMAVTGSKSLNKVEILLEQCLPVRTTLECLQIPSLVMALLHRPCTRAELWVSRLACYSRVLSGCFWKKQRPKILIVLFKKKKKKINPSLRFFLIQVSNPVFLSTLTFLITNSTGPSKHATFFNVTYVTFYFNVALKRVKFQFKGFVCVCVCAQLVYWDWN